MSSKGPPFNLFKYFATERMLKNPKGSLLSDFFGTVRLKNSIFFCFFENFSKTPNVPLQFFEILQQNAC